MILEAIQLSLLEQEREEQKKKEKEKEQEAPTSRCRQESQERGAAGSSFSQASSSSSSSFPGRSPFLFDEEDHSMFDHVYRPGPLSDSSDSSEDEGSPGPKRDPFLHMPVRETNAAE